MSVSVQVASREGSTEKMPNLSSLEQVAELPKLSLILYQKAKARVTNSCKS